MTLDEFFDSTESLRLLRDNIETNLRFMLDTDDVDDLLRLNLIMIRQYLTKDPK